ncbi:hypothetical protein [Halorhabdus rudnickae]|uniref:hypothetical protein n=1 Tax=Halorhabdus rudnickae TaxID=1775544 RepID=UPI00108320BA|nr:hypothetical protein [Halorhabdus rudnickae]
MSESERTAIEQAVLDRLADAETCTPGRIALAVDGDLAVVYDVIGSLRERDLLERVGFDSCRLTDRGRRLVNGRASPAPLDADGDGDR